MKLTDNQLQILREIQNGKFGSVDRDWGFLKRNSYIDFDATDDGMITRDPILTSLGVKELISKRDDFTSEEIKICHILDGLSSQIKELETSIRRDRKELDHDHPLSNSLAELENIIFSFSGIYGGYWQDVTLYPTFDAFVDENIKYLKEVLNPALLKLRKAKIPKSGKSGSGMRTQFLSYLERVENIYHLLFKTLSRSKKFTILTVLNFCRKEWKWAIGIVVAIIGTIFIPIFTDTPQKESSNNVKKHNLIQSPVVAGNVGAINYNTPPKASYLNERSEDTNIQNPEELVGYYFESYNANSFQKACSIFKKIKCDASNADSIQNLSRYADKLSNGYENVQVKELSDLDKKDAVVCVKYSYGLKTDPSPSTISEISSFYVTNREDGLKEITSRVCEKKYDSVLGNRNCPIEAKKKYCLNAF